MPQTQIQQLQECNAQWNAGSAFKVEFLNTGSFFQVTNSQDKAHDISFQCILQSLKDLLGSPKAKQFINAAAGAERADQSQQHLMQNLYDSLPPAAPDEQCGTWHYAEKVMRVLGEEELTHNRAKVVAKEQSKLFFNVISRIVHIALQQTPVDLDGQVPFRDADIQSAIAFLKQVIIDYSLPVAAPAPAAVKTTLPRQKNTIYLGAPGTGKSYTIEQATQQDLKIRTVFHPDMQYGDFVGSLKPRMEGTGASRTIGYEFRPGPFTRALIKALTHPQQYVYLIIEELNRAPAAAVFGDLFQLLDSDSQYEIDLDPDMRDYINQQIPAPINTLSLPANLTLLATMNSSDQGVNALDTAFKRRWAVKYLPVDYRHATAGTFTLPLRGERYTLKWADLARVINTRLMVLGVPEDRLLGHRFLSQSDLADPVSAHEALCYKLFVYLWDDVLRHGNRLSLFTDEADGQKLGSFGQLTAAFSRGEAVFEPGVEDELMAVGTRIAPDALAP